MFIEFLGFVIFSVLQIAVLQIVKTERDFFSYISEMDFQALTWYLRLENSSDDGNIPTKLFTEISDQLFVSLRNDYNVVSIEYSFYN